MLRVGVTGATGFVGRRVLQALRARGDTVVAFTRDSSRAEAISGAGVRVCALRDLSDGIQGLDAVVNLAGEPVAGRRWTAAHQGLIRASRVETTRAVVDAMARASVSPRVLVSGSAVGYYGDRGDETVDEESAAGHDFLAGVCVDWESEAVRAEGFGVRVARLRIGVVFGAGGGALARIAAPFRYGVGGPIGDGRQYVPWIHMDDVVGMVIHALDDDTARGVWNATAPQAVQNRDLATALGRALHRPAGLRVPALALRLAVGQMAEVLLGGQRAVPTAALKAGYVHRYTALEPALHDALALG